MLMPKRVKYRKQMRGRMKGKASRGVEVSFGDFGLMALEPGWITARQIEAARRAGASANFAGSGGAIIGTYTGDEMYRSLEKEMRAIGVGLIQPEVAPPSENGSK